VIAEAIKSAIFGLDIIISDSGEYYIIDMNYFPSYFGFPPEIFQTAFENLILGALSN
jgi:D-alanine-D-alanine ligase-like ATP-grasp enzyme